MAETGFAIAGTGVNFNNGFPSAWSNPSRITASDGSYAQAQLNKYFRDTQILRATNFGFSIPSGADILGVTVRYRWYAADNNVFFPGILRLWNGSSNIGNNIGYESSSGGPSLPTSMGNQDYGSASNLWGATLTPSTVNSSGFGVEASVHYTGNSSSYQQIYADAVWLNIAYSVGGNQFINESGIWKKHDVIAKQSGVWKPANQFAKQSGIWKEV